MATRKTSLYNVREVKGLKAVQEHERLFESQAREEIKRIAGQLGADPDQSTLAAGALIAGASKNGAGRINLKGTHGIVVLRGEAV